MKQGLQKLPVKQRKLFPLEDGRRNPWVKSNNRAHAGKWDQEIL